MTTSPVMAWLAAGIPITLLCDLIEADGLDAVTINAVEPPPCNPLWQEIAVPDARPAPGAEGHTVGAGRSRSA